MKRTAETPAILRTLRSLKVVVLHPLDQDGEELLAQLQRIGCDVEVFWPRLDSLPAGTGVGVMAMRPETLSMTFPWLRTSPAPPVIPGVAYENPIIIEAVLQLNAFTTSPSPGPSSGLLTPS